MRNLILFLLISGLYSCRETHLNHSKEKLELILIGLPQDFKDFDTSGTIPIGAQQYFKYTNGDSITTKVCSYLNGSGEPIIPVNCIVYKSPIDKDIKEKFEFFMEYAKNNESGELVKNQNGTECYCDLFGGWIAIYTDKNLKNKYFLFDCCSLPDSIHSLCDRIRQPAFNQETNLHQNSNQINTDSLTSLAYKALENEFKLRRSKQPKIKFIRPK